MGILEGVLGVGKLLTNFIGGGSGSTTNTTSNQTGTSSTSQSANSAIEQSQSEKIASKTASQGLTSTAQAVGSEQSTRNFSDGFLQLLEEETARGLARAGIGSSAAAERLGQITSPASQFDGREYVNNVTRAAENSLVRDQSANRNKIMTMTGGSTTGNSQAALLDSRMRTDAEAQLAGIKGEAEARAEEIKRNRSSEIAGLASSLDSGLASLLATLKGGETAFVGQEQTALESSQKNIGETTSDRATNMYQKGNETGLTSTNSTANLSGSERTPFNWTKAVGSIFDDLELD